MYLKWGKTKRKNQIGITDKTGILTSIALRRHRSLTLVASNLKLCTEIKEERKKERKKEKELIKKKISQFTLSRTNQSKKHPTRFKANNTITKKDPISSKHSQGKKIGKCYEDIT